MKTNLLMHLIRMAALSACTLLPSMACSYSATSAVVRAEGGYATIQVNTQPGCAWQVTASQQYMSFASANQGRGSGAVRLYLQPNYGTARIIRVNGLVYVPPTLGGRSGSPGGWVTVFQSNVTEYGRR
jgi:hypothetical protein